MLRAEIGNDRAGVVTGGESPFGLSTKSRP